MFKMKLITVALVLSTSPFAFGLARLALGTKTGGMSGGEPL
jgi:hypothetical protein